MTWHRNVPEVHGFIANFAGHSFLTCMSDLTVPVIDGQTRLTLAAELTLDH